jgi:haloacetate dehalogenase
MASHPLFEAFEGFSQHWHSHDGVTTHARIGGSGPPLLLLHGHPQTHAMWHAVAPGLAQHHAVVCADLRGYGDSSKPSADAPPDWGSKRHMAADMVALMRSLGHSQFDVLAHDRGARAAHRLALDHAGAVKRLMLLDIAPTLAMYAGTGDAFARAYWHWFFLIQPAPLPERLIEANPVAYVREVMGRRHAGLAVFAPEALAEYERCVALPGSAAGICADYRASAGVDLEHDRASLAAGQRVQQPLRVLWGAHGVVNKCFDVPTLWQAAATQYSGRTLDCGHYLAEEKPAEVLAEALAFFRRDALTP